MKISLLILLLCICPALNAQEDSDKGHAEHFVAGTLIGGVTSYFVFKKTNDKWKSWLIGAGTAVVVGLTKEAIDPAIGEQDLQKILLIQPGWSYWCLYRYSIKVETKRSRLFILKEYFYIYNIGDYNLIEYLVLIQSSLALQIKYTLNFKYNSFSIKKGLLTSPL